MPTRVYKVAAELGVDSKTLMAKGQELGITIRSHLSSLTEVEVQRLTTALSEPQGKVTRFDQSTGKGEVSVSSRGVTKELAFDLRYTRLADSKYVPIRAGDSVRVTLDDERVESIRTDQS